MFQIDDWETRQRQEKLLEALFWYDKFRISRDVEYFDKAQEIHEECCDFSKLKAITFETFIVIGENLREGRLSSLKKKG